MSANLSDSSSSIEAAISRGPSSAAIDFVAEHGADAVVPYTLTMSAVTDPEDEPDIVLYDRLNAQICKDWRTVADLKSQLGPVVWPDLGAYRNRAGWNTSELFDSLRSAVSINASAAGASS